MRSGYKSSVLIFTYSVGLWGIYPLGIRELWLVRRGDVIVGFGFGLVWVDGMGWDGMGLCGSVLFLFGWFVLGQRISFLPSFAFSLSDTESSVRQLEPYDSPPLFSSFLEVSSILLNERENYSFISHDRSVRHGIYRTLPVPPSSFS